MAQTVNKVQLPEYAKELFNPYRYKVLHGGRGGAKTTTYAMALVLMAAQRKMRIMCCREFQNSIDESVKPAIEKAITLCGLDAAYDVIATSITCKRTGSTFSFKGIARNVMSIKGWEDYDVCWIEEAHITSAASWELLKPTIRKDGSEIWLSFNRHSRQAPVDKQFLGNHPPENAFIKQVNYTDNPFFPDVLEQERLECLESEDEETYNHIWLGAPDERVIGGIFARHLDKLREKGRICSVPYIHGEPVYTSWDLGYNDNTSIWFWQVIAGEIRIIDFYQNRLEDLEHYFEVIEEKPYQIAMHNLPHDANQKRMNATVSIAGRFSEKGYPYRVLASHGKGKGVAEGIDAARKMLGNVWIDADNCRDGLDAIGAYRYEYDENNKVFKKNPLHDWSSDASDSFRYMAVSLPLALPQKPAPPPPPPQNVGWMGV